MQWNKFNWNDDKTWPPTAPTLCQILCRITYQFSSYELLYYRVYQTEEPKNGRLSLIDLSLDDRDIATGLGSRDENYFQQQGWTISHWIQIIDPLKEP